jgi:hypothetical protein
MVCPFGATFGPDSNAMGGALEATSAIPISISAYAGNHLELETRQSFAPMAFASSPEGSMGRAGSGSN